MLELNISGVPIAKSGRVSCECGAAFGGYNMVSHVDSGFL